MVERGCIAEIVHEFAELLRNALIFNIDAVKAVAKPLDEPEAIGRNSQDVVLGLLEFIALEWGKLPVVADEHLRIDLVIEVRDIDMILVGEERNTSLRVQPDLFIRSIDNVF